MAKRQRKEKACENRTKEDPRTGVRTAGETNTPLSWLANLHIAGSVGRRQMHKRRDPRRIETSPLGSICLIPQRCVILCFFLIKQSCNRAVTLIHRFNLCCSDTELRKLHTSPTYMVPCLEFNLAEMTSVWPLEGWGQAQQKPNSAKLTWQKLNVKKTQHSESDRKPSILETRTAKTYSAESSHGSVSDSRRPPVKVVGPCTYVWKDIWQKKKT